MSLVLPAAVALAVSITNVPTEQIKFTVSVRTTKSEPKD